MQAALYREVAARGAAAVPGGGAAAAGAAAALPATQLVTPRVTVLSWLFKSVTYYYKSFIYGTAE